MADLAIVLTARPSYAKLKPVIQACIDIGVHPALYVCASALLTRYGNVHAQVRQDFPDLLTIPVYSVFEGGELVSSVLSTGALISALGHEFSHRRPRLVVVMADRHETLGASIAAAYQNIPVAHLQGGEVSGNIDNKVRNANTMLADYHFPATQKAKYEVHALLREDEWWDGSPDQHVWNFGCPSIDVARIAQTQPPVTDEELGGDGPPIDLSQPFYTVLYHPETDNQANVPGAMLELLTSLYDQPVPWVVFWPGQDAGMETLSKEIRNFKAFMPMRTVRTLPPERFLRLMGQTTALIGNSSTGIRECSYIGTPVCNLGNRQQGREQGGNVFRSLDGLSLVPHMSRRGNTLYGDGYASPKIAAKLKELLCR